MYSFNTICHIIFAWETNKVLNRVSLLLYIINYSRYTVPTSQITRRNYIHHTYHRTRIPLYTSHLKCIVCAFCMLCISRYMNTTRDRNMRRNGARGAAGRLEGWRSRIYRWQFVLFGNFNNETIWNSNSGDSIRSARCSFSCSLNSSSVNYDWVRALTLSRPINERRFSF